MIDKKNIAKLIPIANDCIQSSGIVNNGVVQSIYNGKIAALSVSIALSGLLPSLTMYSRSTSGISESQKILGIISYMIKNMNSPYNNSFNFNANNTGSNLTSFAINNGTKELRDAIIHCTVALKLVIRTYEN